MRWHIETNTLLPRKTTQCKQERTRYIGGFGRNVSWDLLNLRKSKLEPKLRPWTDELVCTL